MTFSILFWNIWYLNQTGDADKIKRLKCELDSLIRRHQPDCIALCEVVQPHADQPPPVIEFLRKFGYKYDHQAKMANLPGYWMSGVTISSKLPLKDRRKHTISVNGSAVRQGYPNIKKEVISAQITLRGGPDIKIISAHPSATIDSVKQHYIGKRNIEKLIRTKPFATNTILVGDINEWSFMPLSFRSGVKDIMHCRTGSFANPTWRHNGHPLTPLRLNLDYLYWSRQSDFRLKDFQVLSSAVSDHKPLLTTFEY